MSQVEPTPQQLAETSICLICRVLLERDGGRWRHPQALRERFADAGVCDTPRPGRRPKAAEWRFGRGRSGTGERYSVLARVPEAEAVPEPEPEAVMLGVGGSYRLATAGPTVLKLISWGFVTSSGHYGMGCSSPPGRVVGFQRELVGELRAVYWGLKVLPPRVPVTIVTGSAATCEILADWRDGTLRMPDGYSLQRSGGASARLLLLAELIHRRQPPVAVTRPNQAPWLHGARELTRICRSWGMSALDKAAALDDAREVARAALAEAAASVVLP